MMTCIIVDDEPIAHDVLRNHLNQLGEIRIVGNFFNAFDAKRFFESNKVDLMFLDVEMPALKGIDFLTDLVEKPLTIITTAYRDYAVEGFELGVVDYLLKPISLDRLTIAIKRIVELNNLMQSPGLLNQPDNNHQYEILIKAGTKRVLLDLRTISHAQGLKDYTILFTEDKKYLVKGSVKAMEAYLPELYFMRVHRSFLVAKDRIKFVNRNKIDLGDLTIPIGRHYREVVARFLDAKRP
jgi:DNA-binding LytR/AlgR family response regulator